MVWEQMEMRAGVVVELLEEMFAAGGSEGEESGDGMEEEEDEGESESEGEEESEAEEGEESDGASESFDDEEYYRELAAPRSASDAVEQGEEEEDPLADINAGLSLDSFDTPGSGRPQRRFVAPF